MAGLSISAPTTGAAAALIGGTVTGGAKRSGKTNEVSGGSNLKLQRIINKFKSGKKLTSGELSYLATNAPDIYAKVARIMQRREQLEKRLEMAESKEEVQMIMMEEMQSVEKFCQNSDDDFEKTSLVNQMMDAYHEKTKSPGYKTLPDTQFEKEALEMGMTVEEAWKAVGEEEGLEDEEPLIDEAIMQTREDTVPEEEMVRGAGRSERTGAPEESNKPAESNYSEAGSIERVGNPKTSGSIERMGNIQPQKGQAGTGSAGHITYTAKGMVTTPSGSSKKKGKAVDVAI